VHPTQPVEIFGSISTPFGTLANGHPLTSAENFMEIVQGEPLHQGGGLNARGVDTDKQTPPPSTQLAACPVR